MDFIRKLFDTDFMPHGHCYFWRPEILWPHVIGDALTFLSYYLIPVLLILFIRKRKDVKFEWIFLAFAAFILACGTVHFLAIISVWYPIYRLEAVMKMIMALVSVGTVFLLAKNYKVLLNFPSPVQLRVANENLRQEVEQRKLIEQELRESEEKFRLAMNYAPIAKALVGIDGKWLTVNRAFCMMLGYNEVELLQTDFQSITHPDDLNTDLDLLNQMLNGDIEAYNLEKRYIHKNGHQVWGLLSVSLVKDDNRKPLYFISQIVNIDDHKKAEEKVLALNQNLEEEVKRRTLELTNANQDLENFTYTVTHDLRLPLKNLIGLSDMLLDDYRDILDEDGQECVEFISINAKKMDRLTVEILEFSRAGQMQLDKSVFDISQLFQEAFDSLKRDYIEKDIEWKMGALPVAFGDQGALQQVCMNLISNALKYSSKKEKIQIEVSGYQENGNSVYRVQDNGCGFDDGYQQKLFALFQRLHKQSDFKGTGVGLAMSHRIIQKHDGRIWAESKMGEGATFFFSLPI